MADIRLAKPAAGAAETVPCAPEARFVFDFPATDATLARDGDNLAIQFEDGSRLNLEGFYTEYNEDNLPSFSIDGTEVAAADFFAAMNEPDLMPAAGPGAGTPTGGRFHEWGNASLAAGLDHLDGLDLSTDRAFTFDDTLNAVGGAPEGAYAALADAAAPTPEPPAPDNPVIITPDVNGGQHTLQEKHLQDGSAADATLTSAEGTLHIDAPDGVAQITVGGAIVWDNGALQQRGIESPGGKLNILGFNEDTGELTYSFELEKRVDHLDNEGESLFRDFTVTVTDTNNSVAESTLGVTIVDDTPVLQLKAGEDHARYGSVEQQIGTITTMNYGADGAASLELQLDGNIGEYKDGYYIFQGVGAIQIKEGQILFTPGTGSGKGGEHTLTMTIRDVDTDEAQDTITFIVDATKTNPIEISLKTYDEQTRGGRTSIDKADVLAELPEGATLQSGDYPVEAPDGTVVATLTVGNDGSITVTQIHAYTGHEDGAGKNDSTMPPVSIPIILGDGTTAEHGVEVTVTIVDDIPSIAIVDGFNNQSVTAGESITGEWTPNFGADIPEDAIVTIKSSDGGEKEFHLSTQDKVSIKDAYGELTVYKDGKFIYEPFESDRPFGEVIANPSFTFSITDADGDTADAKLNVEITGKNHEVIIKPVEDGGDTLHVFDAGLSGGSQDGEKPTTASGALKIDSVDGVESIALRFGSTSYDVPTNGTLTTFPIGEEGSLTACYNDGELHYTYTLAKAAQHGEGQYLLVREILVTVKDKGTGDGDVVEHTLTVTIDDDAPESGNALYTISGAEITGSIFTGLENPSTATADPLNRNAATGADSSEVTVEWKLPSPSWIWNSGDGDKGAGTATCKTATGELLTLHLYGNGSYRFEPIENFAKALQGLEKSQSFEFQYTIRDADGDVSTVGKLDFSLPELPTMLDNVERMLTVDEAALVAGDSSHWKDTDPHGKEFTVSAEDLFGKGYKFAGLENEPTFGTATVENGTLTYTLTEPTSSDKVTESQWWSSNQNTRAGDTTLGETLKVWVVDEQSGNRFLMDVPVYVIDDVPVSGYATYEVSSRATITGSIFNGIDPNPAAREDYVENATTGADGEVHVVWELPENSGWQWENGATSGNAFLITEKGKLFVELKEDGSYTFDSTGIDFTDSQMNTSHGFTYTIYGQDGDYSTGGKLDFAIQGDSKPAAASFSATEQPEGDAGEAFLYKSLGEDGESDAGTGTDSFAVNDIAAYSPSDYFFDAPEDKITGLVADADTSLDELLGNGSVRNVEVLFKGADAMSLTSMEKLAEEYGIGMSEDGTRMTIPLAQEEDMKGWTDRGNGVYEHHGEDGKVDLTMETANLTVQESDSEQATQAAHTLSLAQG